MHDFMAKFNAYSIYNFADSTHCCGLNDEQWWDGVQEADGELESR